MADEETIVIKVDTALGQKSLAELAANVDVLSKELKTLKKSADVSSESIGAATAKLTIAKAEYSAAASEISRAARETRSLASEQANLLKPVSFAAKATSAASVEMRDLTKNVGAGISIIAILRDNLEALKPVLDKVGNGIKFAAVQAGASEKTVSNLGLAFDSLVHPSHIAANAVESMRRAWKEFEDAIVGSSTVITNNVKTIEQSLSALAAARKAAAEENAEALAAEQAALAATAKEEAALEAAAIKSAQERAKAEAQAAEAIVAALERETQALAAKLAQDQASLAAQLAKGAPLDTSVDTSEAQGEVEDLRREIKKLEDQPLINPDQLNNLNDMKDRAAKLTRTVSDLNNVFTVGSDNWLNDADAANAAAAAQEVYADRLQQAQLRHEDALRTSEDAADAMESYTDQADGAAEALDDVADAAGKIGDEAKKGTDKAGEGLDKMKDGLTEAIPLANELKGILAEIVALGAQADI